MGKTKDYDDYIDWTYANGYDPADYETYEEYITAVTTKVPPKNYKEWEPYSQNLLEANLQDFFINKRSYDVAKATGDWKEIVKTPDPVKERKERVRAVTQSGFLRRQLHRIRVKDVEAGKLGRKELRVTKTEERIIQSIEAKRISGQKYNKAERTMINRGIFSRSAEIQKRRFINPETKQRYTKGEALKRAHKEFE